MIYRKYITCFAALLLGWVTGYAQQVGMYNHYFFKPMVYNPAFAGAGSQSHAMLLSRAQWVSFTGAPQLNVFTLDGPVKKNKIGLGLTLLNDRRGITIRNGGNLAYSYRLAFNDETYILLGLSAGIVNHAIDYSKALAEDYSDPTLFGGVQQRTGFDANAGFAFIWKGLELAAAAPQLLANKLNYMDDSTTRTYYTHARHYMASLKYRILLSREKDIGLAPQFLMRVVPAAPLQFDGNLTLDWNDKFWLGATYKSNYAISVNAGIWAYKRLAIGYSYEVITASIGTYSGISHEIMVNFKFGGRQQEAEDTAKIEESKDVVTEQVYQQRMDSLQQALSDNQYEIRELNKRLEQQARTQQQTQEQLADLQKNMQGSGAQQNAAVGTGTTTTTSQQTTTNEVKTSTQPTATTVSTATGTTQPVTGNGQKNAPAALAMMDSKSYENEVWIASYPNLEFKDEHNANPRAGFYIVVGTFFYQDFAIAEAQRFRKRGFKQCNWIYSENTKHNYIFTNRIASRQEAIKKVKEVQRTSGVKDAWILQLK